MRRIGLLLTCMFVVFAMSINDVEAKRLGGSRSIGQQRSIVGSQPAQPPARQAQQAAPAGQAAAQAAAPGRSWLPMLGGLAAGGLLGAMFGGSGLGVLAMLLMVGIGGVVLFRVLARAGRQAQSQPGYSAAGMPGARRSACRLRRGCVREGGKAQFHQAAAGQRSRHDRRDS